MRVRHLDPDLARLETDADYTAGLGRPVVRGYRKVMAWIRDAEDERDLYALKSLHFEKLKGNRTHQRLLRLNDQYRLIIELVKNPDGSVVVVVSMEDYH